MPEENVEIVRAGAVEAGTQRGLAAFASAVEKIFEAWESWRMEPEQFKAVGDQVAVVVRVARYAWVHEPADALEAAGSAGGGPG